MSDVVIPVRKDPKTGLCYVKLPLDFYGMKGDPKMKVGLKTKDRVEANLRVQALAVVAQLSNPNIGEF